MCAITLDAHNRDVQEMLCDTDGSSPRMVKHPGLKHEYLDVKISYQSSLFVS